MQFLRVSRLFAGCLLCVATFFCVAWPAYAVEITVEVDLVKIERRMVAGAFRAFAVALGNGPYKTSIGGANEKQIIGGGGMFGSAQLADVNRARGAFTSRAFPDGSLIFNNGAGTWTGITIWLTDAGGNTFSAASESNSNGVVVTRAAGDGGAANRRLNITLPNVGPFNIATQPNVVWMRMPAGGGYDGALAGNPPLAGSGSCISAPDANMTCQDLTDLAAEYDYQPLLEDLVICPCDVTGVEGTSWGSVKALYR